jgi:hypothetical protein
MEHWLDAHQILFPEGEPKEQRIRGIDLDSKEVCNGYSHVEHLFVGNNVLQILIITNSEWYGRYVMIRLCIDQLDQTSWKWEHHVAADPDLASANEIGLIQFVAHFKLLRQRAQK